MQQKRSFADQLIAGQAENVHKLSEKDSTGRKAYYFVLIAPYREKAFMKALKEQQRLHLEDWGKVLAS